jgi:hypothetical protein
MIEKISSKDAFLNLVRRQNLQWELIDAGIVEEDKPIKPIPPKKEKIRKEKIKSNNFI